MLGIRIISQYALDELLNKARIKGERNSVSTIQRLNDKLEQLEMENFSLSNKNYSLKLSEDLNDKIMNQSLHGESLLRTAIREIIESQKNQTPRINAMNEELIAELNEIVSENFKTFKKQAQLLVDVAENKSIESITAVEEYLATFNFDSNEE
jgi:Arc/MetJ-type ribon-helix-helix transcriptional regulator